MRSAFRRKSRRAIRWGQLGVTLVDYLGDFPAEFTGHVTGRRYTWNERQPQVWVDKRDLPGLALDGGREAFMKSGESANEHID